MRAFACKAAAVAIFAFLCSAVSLASTCTTAPAAGVSCGETWTSASGEQIDVAFQWDWANAGHTLMKWEYTLTNPLGATQYNPVGGNGLSVFSVKPIGSGGTDPITEWIGLSQDFPGCDVSGTPNCYSGVMGQAGANPWYTETYSNGASMPSRGFSWLVSTSFFVNSPFGLLPGDSDTFYFITDPRQIIIPTVPNGTAYMGSLDQFDADLDPLFGVLPTPGALGSPTGGNGGGGVVPEPASFLLMGSGLAGLAGMLKARRKK